MGNSLLYIFDKACDVERIVRYCTKKNINKILLCPLTIDQDIISCLLKDLRAVKKCDLQTLPYLEYFNKIAFSERDTFIQFIAKLGEEPIFNNINPKDYFKYPNSSFSAWWLSSIVEKNTVKSESYHNLVKLLTILQLKEEHKVKKIISDVDFPDLSKTLEDNAKNMGYEYKNLRRRQTKIKSFLFSLNCLKGLSHYFRLIYKLIIVTVNIRGLNFRKIILENTKYIVITYFPLVDKDALRQKKFINKYYNHLQGVFENKYKNKFIWVAITTDIEDFNFETSVKLGKQINLWGYPLYFIEEWVSIKDLFPILAEYIYFATKSLTKLTSFPKRLEYSREKIDIWPFFEKDWFSSFAGTVLMEGIIYYRVFKNIGASLKNKTVVTYFAENKPWEKALNFAFHDRKNIKTIGILHTTVPLLGLHFFNYEKRFTIPEPDCLACNGKVSLELLQKSDWNRKNTFLWFAIRYQHLKKNLEENVSWSTRKNKILIPLAGSNVEIEETLSYIYQAFKDALGYQIILREHYLYPIKSFIKRLNINFNNDIFTISNDNLNESLKAAKAAIITSSSTALESIALGCPVIIPKLANVVDMSPLSGISDLPIYVGDPKELRNTVDDIMKSKESPLSYSKCKDFIKNYFNFFNSEEELLEKLEGCIPAK